MQCRYCGRDIKSIAGNLTTEYSPKCEPSPTGKHVSLSDGTHCVYCGRATRPLGKSLTTEYGAKCKGSPSGNHELQ